MSWTKSADRRYNPWMLQFLLAAIAIAAPVESVNEVLLEHGLKLKDAGYFQVKENRLSQGETKNQHIVELLGKKRERIVLTIVSPVDEETAKSWTDSEKAAVKRSYAAPQMPYMGDINQAMICPKEFGPYEIPLQIGSRKVTALTGASSDRGAFGACTKAAAKNKGAYFSFYDRAAKKLFVWRVFSPWTDSSPVNSAWLADLLKPVE